MTHFLMYGEVLGNGSSEWIGVWATGVVMGMKYFLHYCRAHSVAPYRAVCIASKNYMQMIPVKHFLLIT